MKKGSVVTISDLAWGGKTAYPGENFVTTSGEDSDGEIRVIHIETGLPSWARAYGVKKVKGEKPYTVVSKRAFGYEFIAMQRGKDLHLLAGCRHFRSVKEAKRHWSNGPKGFHYQVNTEDRASGWFKERKEDNKKHLAKMTEVYNELKEKLNG